MASRSMRFRWRIVRIGLLLAMVSAAFAQALPPPPAPIPRLTMEEQQEGWELLFDGETVAGWKAVNAKGFPYDGWAVENGYLRTVTPGPAGDIVSVRSFSDFEFSFKWLIEEGGNSGVKYLVAEGRPEPNIGPVTRNRLPRLLLLALGFGVAVYVLFFRRKLSRFLVTRILAILVIMVSGYNLVKGARSYFDLIVSLRHSAVGLEYQVLDDVANPEPRSNPKASAASLYILLEADREKELYSDDRFNEGRVLVQGNQVQHWLNGKKVLEYRLDDPELQAAVDATKYSVVQGFLSKEGGQLALQHHNDRVWFKDLKIRPLPPIEAEDSPAGQGR